MRRHLRVLASVHGPLATIGSATRVCWCSNDYLGLSVHPALTTAACNAMGQWGVGARASRLLAGTTRLHADLERALAQWFGAEAAIVFASGYLANAGALGTLLSPQDTVVVDRLAHASLIDAARASGARLRAFRHNDPQHAAMVLANEQKARRRVIVTEGVFSMDGDCSPLPALLTVAEQQDALLYLDDAHGAFVLGHQGRGSPEAQRVRSNRLLYMGTLGKALGCQGGFLVGPRAWIDLLQNRARTFIYATALAIPVIAAAHEALRVLRREPQRRARLQMRISQLHAALQRIPNPPTTPSHIVPIILGSTASAQRVAQRLWRAGHWAPAIRPPTVPKGTARLRLSVTALHTPAQIASLASAIHHG